MQSSFAGGYYARRKALVNEEEKPLPAMVHAGCFATLGSMAGHQNAGVEWPLAAIAYGWVLIPRPLARRLHRCANAGSYLPIIAAASSLTIRLSLSQNLLAKRAAQLQRPELNTALATSLEHIKRWSLLLLEHQHQQKVVLCGALAILVLAACQEQPVSQRAFPQPTSPRRKVPRHTHLHSMWRSASLYLSCETCTPWRTRRCSSPSQLQPQFRQYKVIRVGDRGNGEARTSSLRFLR